MNIEKVKTLQKTISEGIKNMEEIEKSIDIKNMKPGFKNSALDESNMLLFALTLLESLGWKISEGNILLEGKIIPNNLKPGQRRRRVDIGLLNREKGKYKYKVLVELKKGDIVRNSRKQISNYMVWSNTTYGVLLNKKQLELFENRVYGIDKKGDSYQQYQIFILSWEDIVKYRNVLNLISKDSIESGTTKRIIGELRKCDPWSAYFNSELESRKLKKMKAWDANEDTCKIRLDYITDIIARNT